MPTVSQNINYVWKKYVFPKRGQVVHYVKVFVVLLLVSLALECFLFNCNYFRFLSSEEIVLDDQLNLQTDSSGYYILNKTDNFIEFHNLNVEANNIFIDFTENQGAHLVKLKINFTDEGHQTYFDSTDYTEGIPEVNISTTSRKSKFINLATSGKVDDLRIQIVDEEGTSYPIKLSSISLNKPRDFCFIWWRFFFAFFILFLIYAFRPSSSLYKIWINKVPVISRTIIVITACVETILITCFLFLGSNQVGVATEHYNQGSWDNSSFINTFDVGGENTQQYALLAQAMSRGQLYLDTQPPDWLIHMDNPYDKGARDELQKQTGVGSLHDVAYWNGHYYVYFGVVPVIIFYLPFYLITGCNFPSALGVMFALIAFIIGCTILLDNFARNHFKRVNLGLFLLLQIPLVMCSGVLYLAKFPSFYSLPIACALAFSVWGIYFWLRGRRSHKRCAWYVAGSICMALVVGCRPQIVLLSCMMIPLFWHEYISMGRIATKKGLIELACLLAPYIVIISGLMLYNYARFGSMFDFGANYNLTINDMTKRGWNLGRIFPAFFAYFLQPPNMCGVFPFIQEACFATTYMGQTTREITFGGILVCLPIMWVLLFAVQIIKCRIQIRSTRTIAGVISVFLAGALIIALLDAQVAGILQRYYADFSFILILAAILLYFIVFDRIPEKSILLRNLTRVLLFAVAVSVTYSLLICFVPEPGWYAEVYPCAYQDFLEAILFWT